MKRSDFLKRLGIGLGVAVVAPQVLANVNPTEDDFPDEIKKEISEAWSNAESLKTIPSSWDYASMYDTMLSPEVYGDIIRFYGRTPLIDILSL